MDWKTRPMLIYYWPQNCDYVMGIDENGTPDLKHAINLVRKGKEVDIHNRYFTATGVILHKEEFIKFKDRIISLKHDYWENAECLYNNEVRRVCFHSKEIRKQLYPFDPNTIDYKSFISDLTDMIRRTNMTIITSTIDKQEHVKQYQTPEETYNLCMTFVVERFAYFLNKRGKTGFIVLESRGKKEDQRLLNHIVNILENGTYFCHPITFKCIKGVYFNPKWSALNESKKTFVLLELADLVSYPIYRKYALGIEKEDYKILEHKLDGYPDFYGKGLKLFPRRDL